METKNANQIRFFFHTLILDDREINLINLSKANHSKQGVDKKFRIIDTILQLVKIYGNNHKEISAAMNKGRYPIKQVIRQIQKNPELFKDHDQVAIKIILDKRKGFKR